MAPSPPPAIAIDLGVDGGGVVFGDVGWRKSLESLSRRPIDWPPDADEFWDRAAEHGVVEIFDVPDGVFRVRVYLETPRPVHADETIVMEWETVLRVTSGGLFVSDRLCADEAEYVWKGQGPGDDVKLAVSPCGNGIYKMSVTCSTVPCDSADWWVGHAQYTDEEFQRLEALALSFSQRAISREQYLDEQSRIKQAASHVAECIDVTLQPLADDVGVLPRRLPRMSWLGGRNRIAD
jgi:hypothetical protein